MSLLWDLMEDLGNLKQVDPQLYPLFRNRSGEYFNADDKRNGDFRHNSLGQESPIEVIRVAKPKEIIEILNDKSKEGLILAVDGDQQIAIRDVIIKDHKGQATGRVYSWRVKPHFGNYLKLKTKREDVPGSVGRHVPRGNGRSKWIPADSHLVPVKMKEPETFTEKTKKDTEQLLLSFFKAAADENHNVKILVIGSDDQRVAKNAARQKTRQGMVRRTRARDVPRSEYVPQEQRGDRTDIDAHGNTPVIDPKTGRQAVRFPHEVVSDELLKQLRNGLMQRLATYKRSLAPEFRDEHSFLQHVIQSGFLKKFKIWGITYEFTNDRSELAALLGIKKSSWHREPEFHLEYKANSEDMHARRELIRQEMGNEGKKREDFEQYFEELSKRMPPSLLKVQFIVKSGAIVPGRIDVERNIF